MGLRTREIHKNIFGPGVHKSDTATAGCHTRYTSGEECSRGSILYSHFGTDSAFSVHALP